MGAGHVVVSNYRGAHEQGAGFGRLIKGKASAVAVASQGATASSPTVAPAANPLAMARGAVDAQTAAFKGIIANVVKPKLFPAGFQLFEMEPAMWKMIQYPSTIYTCSPENKRLISFRTDLYTSAQQAITTLIAATQFAPFSNYTLPPLGSPERANASTIIADWLVCMYSWISLAMFATDIQPGFLCADKSQTKVDGGQLTPTRSPGDGLPKDLSIVMNDLIGAKAQTGQDFTNNQWGPCWAGFYDRGEASNWLKCDFTPQVDDRIRYLTTEDALYINGWLKGKTLPASEDQYTMKHKVTDPWWFWYYTAMHATDLNQISAAWIRWDTKGRDKKYTYSMPGLHSIILQAKTWGAAIQQHSIADWIMQSTGWYMNNYVPYWTNKLGGAIDISIAEADAASRAQRDGVVAAKQGNSTKIVNSTMGAVTAVCMEINPIAGAIAAACQLVANGIMRLVFWRRKKKNKNKVDLMQPLTLRTLSDPDCSYFPPSASLPESLNRVITEIGTEIAASNAGATSPTPQLSPPPGSQPAVGVSLQPGAPSAATTATVTQAPPLPASQIVVGTTSTGAPITAAQVPQGGSSSSSGSTTPDNIRTSNAAKLPTLTAMPTTAVTQSAIQAAQATSVTTTLPGTAPLPSSGFPWKWLVAAFGIAGGVAILRRR